MPNTKILLSIPHNHYVELTPKELEIILEAPLLEAKWSPEYQYTYHISKNPFDIIIISEKDIINPKEEAVINIEEILAENNRLSREIELLKEKVVSNSKELI